MKLTAKFVLNFILIAIFPVAILGYLSYVSAKTALQNQALSDLTLVAEIIEGHLYSSFEAVKGRVLDFSSDGFIRDSVEAMQKIDSKIPRYTEVQKTLSSYLRLNKMPLDKSIHQIFVIGLNGRVIASTGKHMEHFMIGRDESMDEYFKQGKKGVYMSDVHTHYKGKLFDHAMIAVSAPIFSRDKQTLSGVIVNFYSLYKLEKILSRDLQKEEGDLTGTPIKRKTLDIYFVNKEKVLISPSLFDSEVMKQQVETMPVLECAEGRKTTAIYRSYHGDEVIGASMCIPGTGWTLLAEISTKEAFAPVAALRIRTIALGAVIALFVLVPAYITSESIVTPVSALSKAAQKYAGGDFSVHVPVKTKDEIGKLAMSFNKMAAQLAESQHDLENSNREIDENRKVLQRALDKITSLIQQVANEKNLSVRFNNPNLKKCYETMSCTNEDCICYGKKEMRCWQVAGTFCGGKMQGHFADKYKNCAKCPVFEDATSDPIYQVGEHFNSMMHILDIKNRELEKAYAELQTTQAHLLHQDKMASIGQLAAGVAHEINNPIGFISGNLGALGKYIERLTDFVRSQIEVIGSLKDREAADRFQELREKLKLDYILEDIHELIRESLEGVNQVTKIVDDLKGFSRVDEAEYKYADINDCIESTLRIVWNELKYKTSVKKEYGDIPPTKCYPQQLNQVFINLLVNAAQAIEKQGDITIKTWNGDGSIFVSISDTGKGIPEKTRGRVFEPFFTTKEVGEGTGLGLSIAYGIVKKHHGEITVQSETGKGSTFTVEIPVV